MIVLVAASYSTGRYDAIVLAGGAGRRLGGVDKAALQVGGRSLLERVLAALRDADRTVVVGPRRSVPADRNIPREPRWVRERPPGSGPLAGLAAGMWDLLPDAGRSTRPTEPTRPTRPTEPTGPNEPARADLSETAGTSEWLVMVCATDLPWLDSSTVRRLTATLGDHPETDAAMLCDTDGRQQPLAACYRGTRLASVLQVIGDPTNRPMRLLFDHLDVTAVPATRQARDIDTPDDLEVAMLDEWARRLAEELGVGEELADLELDPILNLARDAAHTIERPAAPLTTFIAGYAAARRAAGSAEVRACIEQAAGFTATAGETER